MMQQNIIEIKDEQNEDWFISFEHGQFWGKWIL